MIVRILSVDDDADVQRLLQEALTDPGYNLETASSARQCLAAIERRAPDLLILDWHLPDLTGAQVCAALAKAPRSAMIPILMLTAVRGDDEKVHALTVGADDYLTKPFQVAELQARVRALLRRRTPWLVPDQTLEAAGLAMNPASYKAYVQGKDIELTKLEFELLYLLVANADRILSRAYIADRVLGAEEPSESRPLDVHVSHIRKKLGQSLNERIETARNQGYLFTLEGV